MSYLRCSMKKAKGQLVVLFDIAYIPFAHVNYDQCP